MAGSRFLVVLSLLLLCGMVPAAYSNTITLTSTGQGFLSATDVTIGTFEATNIPGTNTINSTQLTFTGAGTIGTSIFILVPVIPAGYHITSAIVTATGGFTPGSFGELANLTCYSNAGCSPVMANFIDTGSVQFTDVFGVPVTGSNITLNLITAGLLPQVLFTGNVTVDAYGTFNSASLVGITDPGFNGDTTLSIRHNIDAFGSSGTLTILAQSPEPGTLVFLGTGLTAILGVLRRRLAS